MRIIPPPLQQIRPLSYNAVKCVLIPLIVVGAAKRPDELFLWCNKHEVTCEHREARQVYAIKRLIDKDRARCRSYRIHVVHTHVLQPVKHTDLRSQTSMHQAGPREPNSAMNKRAGKQAPSICWQ